jgi:hypothetical protein
MTFVYLLSGMIVSKENKKVIIDINGFIKGDTVEEISR